MEEVAVETEVDTDVQEEVIDLVEVTEEVLVTIDQLDHLVLREVLIDQQDHLHMVIDQHLAKDQHSTIDLVHQELTHQDHLEVHSDKDHLVVIEVLIEVVMEEVLVLIDQVLLKDLEIHTVHLLVRHKELLVDMIQ